MQTIALSTVPNQTFSTTLNGNRYVFSIYQCNGIMCYDVSINETPVVTGMRLTDGTFLIPYFCYSIPNGNFLLLTNNNDLPNYTLFGTSQTLIYLTEAEIQAAISTSPVIPIPFTPYVVA